MKWVEVIQIRATGCDKDLLKAELRKLVDENDKIIREQMIKVYRRVLIDTDYKIEMIHETGNVEKSGSALGLRLVSGLKAFGLVNHSIWVELK